MLLPVLGKFLLGVVCALVPVVLCVEEDNFYDMLGVSRGADGREIRTQFKKLALELHPDKNKDDPQANGKFAKIARIYEILKDDESRKKYDLFGAAAFKGDTHAEQYNYYYYEQKFGLFDDDMEVISLTKYDFAENIANSNKLWLIVFYTASCSECVALVGVWKELAQQLEDVIRIGAVNCEEERQLCQNEHMKDFPTIILYPIKKPYTGAHEKEDMVHFLLNHIEIEVTDITEEKWTKIRTESTSWVVSLCKAEPCIDDAILVQVAAMLDGIAKVGFIQCSKYRSLCQSFHNTASLVYVELNNGEANVQALDNDGVQSIGRRVLSLRPGTIQLDHTTFQATRQVLTTSQSLPWVMYLYTKDNFKDNLELKKVAALLHNFKIGQLNCKVYAIACGSLYVWKYPAVLIFKTGGGFERYHGHLGAQQLENFAKESAASPNCVSLSPSDFPAVLQRKDGKAWFLDFYAPWCPPCMKLIPEFRKASRHIGSVAFGTIDCTAYSAVCKNLTIRSYPTTALFNASGPQYYQGDHFEKDIVEFLNEMDAPDVPLLNNEAFEEAVGNKTEAELWLVYFFVEWCKPCNMVTPQWRRLAKILSDQPIVHVASVDCSASSALCKQLGVTYYPRIQMYPLKSRGLENKKIYMGHQTDAISIRSWVYTFLPSPVHRLHRDNFQEEVIESDTPWVVMFFAPWCVHCGKLEPHFKAAAEVSQQRNEHLVFGSVNCEEQFDLCSSCGIDRFPIVFYYRGVLANPLQRTAYRGKPIEGRSKKALLDELNQKLKKDAKYLKVLSGSERHDEL